MNREILRLAIPNIISNVSVPLLSTVDTALMGHLSPRHLGAVGIGSMVFNFIYWNFGFLRMGTTGLTAQAFGAGDTSEISQTLGRSIGVGMTLALILLLIQIPLEWLSLMLLQVDDNLMDLVSKYYRIRIWAAPATLVSYVLMGWFFGMQNALYPLYLTVIVNLVNIGLSFLLILTFGMGIEGVAWGTVIAQYAGVLVGVLLLLQRYPSHVRAINTHVYKELEALKKFFIINRDLFIRTLCLTFAFAYFYSESSASGVTILAVNVVLLQMVNWMSYGIDGFAFAAESMVGKYKGAQSKRDLDRTIRYAMLWGFGFAAIFSIIYGIFGVDIFRLFTTDPTLLSAGKPFLLYMIIFPLAGFICYIWDGIYIGLTASITMRNAMLVSLAIFLILQALLKESYGNHGLWIALLAFLLIRGVIQSVLYRLYGWQIR
ncbi:MAG: MATE family efflux transporter [Saprospiraceae bacterium]|nr:MATE family efflux transporter [Saprospiraceae bacterium]